VLKLAFLVGAALAFTRGSAGPGRTESGGKMSGVSVKRLGKVVPGESTARGKPEQVDAAPIVLWANGEPAAVLLHRSHLDGKEVVEAIAPIPESVTGAIRAGGALELETRSKVPEDDADAPRADAFQGRLAVTADLDGDGVDELIVPRRQGGVEVAPWKGSVLRLPGPSGKAKVATYRPMGSQVARLGDRAVVHLLFRRQVHDKSADAAELARVGAGEPYALVRADASGLSRVKLELSPVREVLAVGAINRPGSRGVDELFALYRKDDSEDVWVSRHQLNGGAIGAPRRVYVPIQALWTWQVTFVPRSSVAVATSGESSSIYFLEPEAPANWAHAVDVKGIVGKGVKGFLGVADAGTKPKAVFWQKDAVYAVDRDGTFCTVEGGSFVASKDKAPFQKVPQGPQGQGEVVVVPSVDRGDEFLVVRAHGGGLRWVEHAELMERADRHLDPKEVARERRRAEPALDDRDSYRDRRMEEERSRRGVRDPVRTLEEWRRLLPDSYAEVAKDRQTSLDVSLSVDLFEPLHDTSRLSDGSYRDPEGLRAWLATLSSGPEATFEHVRRASVVQTFRIEAHYGRASSDAARSLVDWRAGPSGTVIVTTAVVAGEKPDGQPGVYVVRRGGGR
jgi:hypothetical protein